MELTEGWPLGIALAAGLVERATQAGDLAAALGGLRSAPDLHAYLSEELLDSLEPELREAALESSVVPVVTPAVERALELPEEFASRIERAGLLVRRHRRRVRLPPAAARLPAGAAQGASAASPSGARSTPPSRRRSTRTATPSGRSSTGSRRMPGRRRWRRSSARAWRSPAPRPS